MASHRKRCTLDTHQAASASHRQLRTQRAEFSRCFPLRNEALGSLSKSGRRRPMKLRTRRKQAAESPLGSTDAIGCLKQLARIASGAGNSPRRRTARPCESSLGTSSVEQRGAACTWSQTSESSKSFLAPAHPDLMLRPRYQIRGTRAPECKGQQPPRPVLACAASILLAQKSRPCTRGGRNAQESEPS